MNKVKKPDTEKKPRVGEIARNNKSSIARWAPFIAIIVAYLLLFLFLRDKLLLTPDIDRSDAFQFNLSLKYTLWQSLRHNTLPFWTNKLQGGFPLMAEGQIGALYLPNLAFLKVFDFVTGYNLLFVSSLFLLTAGMYLLLLEMGTAPLLSFLLSVIFTFNGSLSFRWIHLNVIQVFSLAPLLFWVHLKWYRTGKRKWGFFLAFILSQMAFAGHPQILFIALLGLSFWQAALQYLDRLSQAESRTKFLRYAFWVVLGIVLSLPQLLPTYFLSLLSTRGVDGGYAFATSYSLPVQHLLSFILPFPFGNPRSGTYPDSLSQWGLFWENTPYIGLIFALVSGGGYVYALMKGKTTAKLNIMLGIALFFIIMALGKSSPLYFLFDLPPFGSFRTPPKYLLMAVFFLILASSRLLDGFLSLRKPAVSAIILVLLALNAADLVNTAFSYHLFLPGRQALIAPAATASVKPENRYISMGFSARWHDFFVKKGWDTPDKTGTYSFLNNFLIPNSNLLWNLDIFDVNTGGLRMRRQDYVNASLETALGDGPVTELIATDSARSFLDLTHTDRIVSSVPLDFNFLKLLDHLRKSGLDVYVYGAPVNGSRYYYIPETVTEVKYLDDLFKLHKDGLISASSAIIENHKGFTQKTGRSPEITVRDGGNTLSGNFRRETFVVLRQSWYPELHVTLDGRQAKVYKTNLIHMGVFVPEGIHTVKVSYIPEYFYEGLVSAVIFFAAALAGLKFIKR